MSVLLSVNELSVRYGDRPPIDPVSFQIETGETVALLGASGSGKTSIALALMDLLPDSAVVSGSIAPIFQRGREIAMISQDPTGWLNPVQHVDDQVREALRVHNKKASRVEAHALLRSAGLPDERRVLRAYPHQLSGGMRQRVSIAMALAGRPKLLIADEPTSSLDANIQRDILDLLRRLQAEYQMAILLITHDPFVVDYMQARPVSVGVQTTVAPLSARPVAESDGKVLLQMSAVSKSFGKHDVVTDIDLTVRSGEVVGILGESGSGKTTLLRMAAGLLSPTSGEIVRHAELQYVPQNPYGSLDPRMAVREIIAEPLLVRRQPKQDREARVREALTSVRLKPSFLNARPLQLSGGERQRVALARALVVQPNLLLLDEPASALDIAVRNDILNLLMDLREQNNLSYLLVSHDQQVIETLADRTLRI